MLDVNELEKSAEVLKSELSKLEKLIERTKQMQHLTKDSVLPKTVLSTSVTRFTITTPALGATLVEGDTVNWNDAGTLTNPNDKVDLALIDASGVRHDQGPSTASGSKALINVPAGELTIQLTVILTGSGGEYFGTGDVSEIEGYFGPALPAGWIGSTGLSIVPWSIESSPDVAIGSLSEAQYNTLTGNTWSGAYLDATAGVQTIAGKKALGMTLQPKSTVGVVGSGRVQGRIAVPSTGYCKLRYLIFFPDGFDFGGTSQTGKMGPGLFFGDAVSTGGSLKSNAGSMRSTWRGVSGSIHPETYIYHQDQPGLYGDDIPHTTPVITTGTWHEIILEGHAQSAPNVADGIARYYWNGDLCHEDTTMRWVETGSVFMTQLVWQIFFGGTNLAGNLTQWTPNGPQTLYLSEFAYTTTE